MILPHILLIDDLRSFRSRSADVLIARTSAEGLEALRIAREHRHQWAQIWLDYDLGGDDTTEPVLRWLTTQLDMACPPPTQIVVVHTTNPVGGASIQRALARAPYPVVRVAAAEYLSVTPQSQDQGNAPQFA